MTHDDELLQLTRQLLQSILEGDWKTYAAICDPTLTAFEPESCGELVEGMEFHRFYFDRGGAAGPNNTTLCNPHVRRMGDTAVVSYVRLTQRLDDQGRPMTGRMEETRVYQRQQGTWRHVHFHRSGGGK
jgi:calcium/calmodulin-dependent protein kinase (CaM kinase) II